MDYDYIEKTEKIVFFLHGWGADKSSFSWIENHIASCSMVFVSFSGFGKSPPPKRPYKVVDFVSEIRDLIVKIAKGKKVDIVCHSFGARVAGMLTAIYPELVNSLFIVDGAGLIPRRSLNYYIKIWKYKRIKRKVDKGKVSVEKLKNYGSSDYKALSGVMKKTFVNVVNEDIKPYFKNVKCKTFLFWGENDEDTPLYMAKKLKATIKNSELYVVKNAGHFSFLEDQDAFIYHLNKFLF